jgi:hypothetical protein
MASTRRMPIRRCSRPSSPPSRRSTAPGRCCSPTTTVPTAASSPPPARWPSPATCGVSLNLDTLCYDPLMNDADGSERKPEIAGPLPRPHHGRAVRRGARRVLQIRRDDRSAVMQVLRAHGLAACSHTIGELNTADEIRVWRNAKPLLKEKRATCSGLERRRASRSPACATTRSARRRNSIRCSMRQPGLSATLTSTFRGHRRADDRDRCAAEDCNSARAGRQRPGGNGRRLRPRRLRRLDVHMSDLQAAPCRAD